MTTTKKVSKKVSSDSKEPAKPKIDYAMVAFSACKKIQTSSVVDSFGVLLSKSIPDLANMTGNASTIMLAQTALFIKRSNAALIEALKGDRSSEGEVKYLFKQAKVLSKKQKSKEIW